MASALPEQGRATALSRRAWSAMAAETAAPAAVTGKTAACNPAHLTQGCPRAGLSRTKGQGGYAAAGRDSTGQGGDRCPAD